MYSSHISHFISSILSSTFLTSLTPVILIPIIKNKQKNKNNQVYFLVNLFYIFLPAGFTP